MGDAIDGKPEVDRKIARLYGPRGVGAGDDLAKVTQTMFETAQKWARCMSEL